MVGIVDAPLGHVRPGDQQVIMEQGRQAVFAMPVLEPLLDGRDPGDHGEPCRPGSLVGQSAPLDEVEVAAVGSDDDDLSHTLEPTP